jgi:hypothetical protein
MGVNPSFIAAYAPVPTGLASGIKKAFLPCKVDALANLWPNTVSAYCKLTVAKVLPVKNSSPLKQSGKVIYHPREIERVEKQLRERITAACADFELSKREGNKDYLRALHARAKAEEPGVDGL